MAEEQLERSILESKERDELHAIASAMSLSPAARSKKGDIIDLILEATGVGEASTNGTATKSNGTATKKRRSSNGSGATDAAADREPDVVEQSPKPSSRQA